MEIIVNRVLKYFLAGVEGFEPTPTVLETGMLPLHHTPIYGYPVWIRTKIKGIKTLCTTVILRGN